MKLRKLGLGGLISVSLLGMGAGVFTPTFNQSSQVQAATKYKFKKNAVVIHDLKIKINKVKFLKPSDTDDHNRIIFEYTITNRTKKDIDAISGWQAVFNAYQKNKNTEGELEVGSTPNGYDTELKNQSQKINKGGSVKGVATYNLDNTSTPVVLKATQGVDGKKLGQKAYKVTKLQEEAPLNLDSSSSAK
ncbi:hypothetical protein AYR54_03875 [Loigolactobacillus backii]|uniref:DUF5067 domain-containing protein n=1 Tax=Loigolactobacillus backii TaxID=375175 RepID=UPI0007F07186|nr:DUF5067 domain-containing protein [Loigolactobacillus backii]ANK59456.1 hypothetical protein AYR52_03865 [Loigolactobacillus backii]ANK64449.1 hypothetical protein AYR54_03875 [Loigolactobacillus backii]ANK67155.1 hypothetical protein AYR55_05160 [Loigolactobacillus backii]OLF69500.1 hypothetical protein ACX53_07625 [Loigolactobacillus backii]PIO87800.1 hypothetical protein B8A32_11915 [Loigolactobacillus backii]